MEATQPLEISDAKPAEEMVEIIETVEMIETVEVVKTVEVVGGVPRWVLRVPHHGTNRKHLLPENIGDADAKQIVKAPVRALIRPPLFRLDRIAQLFWSKKTYDRVFAPLKADLVHEWMEAEVAGHRRHAWFIKWVRGPFAQLSHMAMQLPFSIAKRIADAVRARLD